MVTHQDRTCSRSSVTLRCRDGSVGGNNAPTTFLLELFLFRSSFINIGKDQNLTNNNKELL